MPKRHSEFIKHLNKLLEVMTSARLSKLIGVADSRIPEWRRLGRLPSPDTLIKLGKVALEHKLPDPFFFWALAGVDTEGLRLMADSVQKRQYELMGPTVPIPRFRYTEKGREEAGPPVPYPREFVPNPEQTIGLLVDRDATGIANAPRGLFIIDASWAGTADVLMHQNRVIAAYVPGGGSDPAGICIGRLKLTGRINQSKPDVYWMNVGLVSLLMPSTSERMGIPSYHLPLGDIFDPIIHLGSYSVSLKASETEQLDTEIIIARTEEAWSRVGHEFPLDEGVRIIGQVIGRSTGHLEAQSEKR